MKLFVMRRILGLAYIADGLMLLFCFGQAKLAVKMAIRVARARIRERRAEMSCS